MSEADRKYVPFWKWWLHRSASSPSLAHKAIRPGGTAGKRSKYVRKGLASLETVKSTPDGIAESQDSSEDLFFTPRENMRDFFSNDDLLQAQDGYWRDFKSSEELHKGSVKRRTEVDSSESILEDAVRERSSSSKRERRALSASHLSGRQMAPELSRPRPLTSKIKPESRSASSLGLKRTQTTEEMEEGTGEEAGTARQGAAAPGDSRSRKSKKGKRKQEPDIKLTKRTLSLTERAGKGRRSADSTREDKPYTNEQYKGFDIYQEIEDGEMEHGGSTRPSQEESKKEAVRLPKLDTTDTAAPKGWDTTEGSRRRKVTSPVYDVLTPTEIWARRSSARQKDMQAVEDFARNRSASDVNTRNASNLTATAARQRSASVTDNKPVLKEKVKYKFGRKKDSLPEENAEIVNNYDRPGPPRPIYQSPPPPREVGDMSSFQPISRQREEEEDNAEGSKQEERARAAPEHSDTPQPASPKADEKSSPESLAEENDASVHTAVRRTQSEKRTSPVVVRQHQRVKRSHSEPRSARTDVAVPTDALQPIIDDHLVKHNEKVLKELGIDLEALGSSEHKPAARVTSTSPTLSTDSSLSSTKRRPASLPLAPQADDISPVSEFGPNVHDPRARLHFGARPVGEPLHARRSTSKPAPPKRSPTTKLTSGPGQHSLSSHSSNHSTPRSSPQPPRPHPTAPRRQQTRRTEYMHRASSLTSVVMRHETPDRQQEVYGSIIQKTQFRPLYPGVIQQGMPAAPFQPVPWPPALDKAHPGQRNSLAHPQSSAMPLLYDPVPKPRRWSLALSELPQYRQQTPPVQEQSRRRGRSHGRQTAERELAKAAVKNWVIERLSYYPPDLQSMYFNQRWTYRLYPSVHPTIQEEIEEDVFEPNSTYRTVQLKTKSSSDSDHSVGGLRTASLDRLGRRSNAHPAAHAHAHAHTPHYTLPRRPPATQRYQQQPKGKGYGYSPPSAVFDDDPGIMSEAETSSTGFRRGGKQRASLPVSRTPSAKTLDSRFEMDDNSYWDEDPGIMSEAETSSTGRGRNLKPRTSLPIVRTPSKTLERPLGLVFLQYRGETKRALLPNEITSLDTVKALFVRSFPNQLTMQYLDLPSVKIYIHDSNKDMFYDLEDLSGTCFIRDIRDRSVLRVFEGEGVNGQGGGAWDQDQSYFSEPEFDSEFQQQHVHKTKNGKTGGYYMTHSYPPGAPAHTAGVAPIPRGPRPPYSPAAGGVAPPKPQRYAGGPGGPGGSAGGPPGMIGMKGGVRPSAPPAGPPTGPPGGPRPQHLARSYSSYSSSPERIDLLYSPQERMHGDGYLSSPERSPRPYGAPGSAYLTPTPSYEDPYYGGQYGSRSGSVTPIIDEDARSAFYSLRVEQMERQLASLTGLVKKALHTGVASSPLPEHISLAPPPAVVAAAAAASGNTNNREPTTNSNRNSSSNDFLQVPTSSSYKTPAEKQPIKPAIKCSTLPRMSSQDMRLSPEVYNQLRVLQKKAKELRTDVRNLRRTSQANAITMKEILRETVTKITTLLQSTEEGLLQGSADAERVRIQREEESYRQDMSKLDKDLCDLELKVEELRNNVINRRLRVNMSDVENMALILSRSSKTVADLKAKFPILQDGLKGLISAEMERAISEEKFLKEEPDKLESALRRCKKLTGTLVTLKRLASVQEQRVPPNPAVGPNAVANGDPRSTSPTHNEETRPSSTKVCVITPTPRPSPAVAHSITPKGHPPLSRKRTPTSL
ncbi:uncharacterized protein LOC134777967 isoform X10 [Penaeus indicus]|uniref:uncharacterized protein LOC134777967 isoform X10 n=1 Tax=Penaeus indicus TaxID=29960 RepID=UPI00300C504B